MSTLSSVRASYTRVMKFFCEEIWLFDITNVAPSRWNKPLMWMKTLLVAIRIIFRKDMLTLQLPALTFATLMAVVPVLAMIFAIAKGFGYDALIETWLQNVFQSQPVVADTLVRFVHNYLEHTHSGYIIGAGLLLMFYTLLSLMSNIEKVFNDVWHAETRSYRRMLMEYPAIFFLFSMLIMGASFVNALSVSVTTGFEQYLGMGESVSVLLHHVAVIPMAVFFIFLFCIIPNTYVKLRSTIVPALISGALMIILQYYYLLAQVWLSSYNIIYGSFAALPLFLLWLQCSWGICLFGEVLSYANQNIHHFDFDVSYDNTSHEKKLLYCAAVLGMICKQFHDGGDALTPHEIQRQTRIPQQIVNAVIDRLVEAQLLDEVKTARRGTREEVSVFKPIENVHHLTYGMMIERLEQCGDDKNKDSIIGNSEICAAMQKIRDCYVSDSKKIELFNL